MFYLWYSSWYLLGIVVSRIASVLWSCVSFIHNSGSAACLLFRMSFFYDGWERDWLMSWHVGSRELAFAPMESWNEARLHGKTRNSEVFSPYGNVKEASVSTALLHLQCWVASVTWLALCESLMPLQTVLSGKNNSCIWGNTMRNIKMLNKMIPGHWISKWWTWNYNVNPHNKCSVTSAIHNSCSSSRDCYKRRLEHNPSTIFIQLRKSKVDA